MLDFANFDLVVAWVGSHGYLLIFLVFCFEGPIATAAASFLSAAGYFNPTIILVLSIMGDLIPDSIYYFLGYYSHFASIKRIGHYFGLTEYRIEKTAIQIRKHFGKTMLVLKLTPIVSVLGFMAVGYLRVAFRRFISWCSFVTIPKSIIFFSLGYFFGQLYDINKYLDYAKFIFPLTIIVITLTVYGYNKILAILVKKIEKQ